MLEVLVLKCTVELIFWLVLKLIGRAERSPFGNSILI